MIGRNRFCKAYKLFILALTVLLLCACGDKNQNQNEKENVSVAETSTITEDGNDTLKAEGENKESSLSTDGTDQPELIGETSMEMVPEEEPVSKDIIPETYAYALEITINPDLRCYYNEENIIVGVEYLNEDALNAYGDISLMELSMEEGLTQILEAALEGGYLTEEATIQIELSSIENTEVVSDSQVLLDANAYIEAFFSKSEDENTSESSVNTAKDTTEESGNSANDTPAEKSDKNGKTKPTTAPKVEMAVSSQVTEATGIGTPTVCPTCGGKGRSCSECNGDNIVNCKACNGGYETCGACRGTGKDPTGGETCHGCGGAGGYTCSWCGGSLRHICPICWGENTCSACGGSGYIQ